MTLTNKCYTLTGGGEQVTFEVGDMVVTPEGDVGVIVTISLGARAEVGNLRSSNSFYDLSKLRFSNNDVPFNRFNLVLDVRAATNALKQARSKLRIYKKMEIAMPKRRERLRKTGLCEEAVAAQLRDEYPEMF